MKIQILGTGCPKCRQLESNAREAAKQLGIEADFAKITDINEIMDFGVMMTPAIAVDGDVKSSGKLLTVQQLADILRTLA